MGVHISFCNDGKFEETWYGKIITYSSKKYSKVVVVFVKALRKLKLCISTVKSDITLAVMFNECH